MTINSFIEFIRDRIRVHGYGETLVCKNCGKEYTSRGKYDPGICLDCERENTFIGGPLDGMKAGDLSDDT